VRGVEEGVDGEPPGRRIGIEGEVHRQIGAVQRVRSIEDRAIEPPLVHRQPLEQRRVTGDVTGRGQAVAPQVGVERGAIRVEPRRVDRLETGAAMPVEGGAATLVRRQIVEQREPGRRDFVEMRQALIGVSADGGVVTIE